MVRRGRGVPRRMRRVNRCLLFGVVLVLGCESSSKPPPAAPQPQAPPYAQPYPQQPGYPPGYAPQGPSAPGQPPMATPSPPPAVPQRPLLPPLYGSPAWHAEVQSVLAEMIAALPAQQAARVQPVPLQFDPNASEVNAFAGCDKSGRPFLAVTEGILLTFDALAQTKATDELFGTQTYDTYANRVTPQLVQSETASPALPPGIIPLHMWNDARRWSRAREIYDELLAFVLGHELAHHYLDHTGCAPGSPFGALSQLVRFFGVVPMFSQVQEGASDNAGVINVLDAGARRGPQYRWSEGGGLLLLDFFARLERAAGVNPLHPVGLLRSHPNPLVRMPVVQAVARVWHAQHPG